MGGLRTEGVFDGRRTRKEVEVRSELRRWWGVAKIPFSDLQSHPRSRWVPGIHKYQFRSILD